jgi:hypothetical protein
MLLLFASLPIIVTFGPLLFLFSRTTGFDHKQGAVSDMISLPKVKRDFILFFSTWEIFQATYIFLLGGLLVILSLFFGLVALFFPGTKKIHNLLIGLSIFVSLVSMGYLSVNIFSQTIVLVMFLHLAILGFIYLKKIKLCYWVLEYFMIFLYGIWNLSILW